jgi:hypothetical protein
MGRELSQEGKEKLSQLAKERHKRGEFGGPKYGKLGGRPRTGSKKKQRITKAVAEAAEEEKNKNAIIEVFKDAIHPNQPISVRLKGATAWAEIAAQHHKTEIAEVAHQQAQHSREELIEILSEKLTSGPAREIIMKQLEAKTGEVIVDAEVVGEEVDDGDSSAAEAA